jgi:protocatechuate 3,4-dioxygenase, beta subunit
MVRIRIIYFINVGGARRLSVDVNIGNLLKEENMNEVLERRRFLGRGLVLGGMSAFLPVLAKAQQCLETPKQTPGPFYPGDAQFEVTNDLTRLPGSSKAAEGEIVHLHGVVQGADCQPLANANVEIWQACASGRYNNPRDPNPAPLDPNFRYWGEAFSGKDGRFYFKTIKPGAYPAAEDWDRPPHIHVRVSKLGYRELITQMYFAGDPLNDKDLVLLDTPEAQRAQLVVDFALGWGPDGSTGLKGEFKLSLTPLVRDPRF